jgi:hypothetical protein
MALTMFNRARGTNKMPEADIFRQWLMARFNEAGAQENLAGEAESR